jgi:UDP-N-acetylglucosamine:LPS N-acetylglucosamine transferase
MSKTNVAKTNILIVYETAGAGHEIMANILAEILGQDETFTVIKKTGLELLADPLANALTKLWVTCWNTLIRHNLIWLADNLINYWMRLILLPLGDVSAVPQVHEVLDQIHPDVIVCTADTWSKCLGTWAREQQIPFFLVITEFSVFIDLVSPDAIHLCYFPETANAIQSFPLDLTYWSQALHRSATLTQKIAFMARYLYDFLICYPWNRICRNIDRSYPPRNQVPCKVIGFIRSPQHLQKRDPETTRQGLHISNDRPCILIISGSIGGNFCLQYLRLLQQLRPKQLTLIVACGRDQQLLEKVKRLSQHLKQKLKSEQISEQIQGLGFVANLQDWMASADLILARPSAGVLLESLLAHTPLLCPGYTTANDRGTLALIEKYQLGVCFQGRYDLGPKLSHLLDNLPDYRRNIETFVQQYSADFETKAHSLRQTILKSCP